MDKKVEILLGSKKNIKSVDVDTYDKIELSNKSSLITEYDIRNVLSATDIFDAEREANEIYRIYGKIDYISLLNGLTDSYGSNIEDFFTRQITGEYKTVLDSFRFYLVKPSTVVNEINSTTYLRNFQVIATPSDFDIYPAGYSNNVYNEQSYAFNFSRDFDVSGLVDGFGFPLTELYIYAEYIPKANTYNTAETISYLKWTTSTSGTKVSFLPTSTPITIGNNLVTGAGENIKDVVSYSKSLFTQSIYKNQTFYITTPYRIGNVNNTLVWKYNPFIPLRLRYFANELNLVNTGNTVYDETNRIPYYATDLGNGNFIWKNILPQGLTDPTSGLGVDYPFVNKKRYLFSSIVLDIIPDLTDTNTNTVFKNIKYGEPDVVNNKPLDDLNNIGKPCQ